MMKMVFENPCSYYEEFPERTEVLKEKIQYHKNRGRKSIRL